MASAFFRDRALKQPITLLRNSVRARDGYPRSQACHRSQHRCATMQPCSFSRGYHSRLHGNNSDTYSHRYSYKHSSNSNCNSNSNSNSSRDLKERLNGHSLCARSNLVLLGPHRRGRLALLCAREYSTATASQTEETSLQHQSSHSESLELQPPNILPVDTPLQLSNEQRFLLRKVIEDKKSVFFTGSAGTGKSVLLRQLIQDLKQVYKPGQVAVTASTGIAACNIGGCTLHSFAGVGLASGTVDQLMVKLDEKKRNKARWRKTKVLIIDEISMVDGALFDKLEEIARRVKKNDKPFGGIQLIVTGDFFQLPPVVNTSHAFQDPSMSPLIFPSSPTRASLSGSRSTSTIVQRDSADYLDQLDEDPYFEGEFSASSPSVGASTALTAEVQPQEAILCFDAKSWKKCIEYTLQLTEVFRQRDQRFINMLTEMRHGKLSDETCRIFKELERTPQYPDDGIQATELFALRKEVEMANHRHLAELAGPVYVYQPRDHGPWKDVMDRVCIAPTRLQLKENAQVMLIKNLTPTLVNGSMGIVVGFHKDNTVDMETNEVVTSHFPVVRFVGEEDDLVIRPEEWKLELPDGEVLGARIQVPLILSWAMSIHKSQGQTIERLKVDMGKIFEVGQAYVAISRATTLEGLQVVNFNKRSVLAHDRVGAFYDGLISVQEMMNLEKQAIQEHLKLGGKRKRTKKALQAIEAAAYETLTAARNKEAMETLTENSGMDNQKAQQEPVWKTDVEELSSLITTSSLLSTPRTLLSSSPPTPPVLSTKKAPTSLLSTSKVTGTVRSIAAGLPMRADWLPYNTTLKSKPLSSKSSVSSAWPTPEWLQKSSSTSSNAPGSLPSTATQPTGSSRKPHESTFSARPWYSGAKPVPLTATAATPTFPAKSPITNAQYPSSSKAASSKPKPFPSARTYPRREVSVVPAAEAPSLFIPSAAKPVASTRSSTAPAGQWTFRDARSSFARSEVTSAKIVPPSSSAPSTSSTSLNFAGKTSMAPLKNAPVTPSSESNPTQIPTKPKFFARPWTGARRTLSPQPRASTSTLTLATATQSTGFKPKSSGTTSQGSVAAARSSPISAPRGSFRHPSSNATTKSREQSAPRGDTVVHSRSWQRTQVVVPARRS